MGFKKNIIAGELPKLVGDGVITRETSEAILRYYEKIEGPKSNTILIAFGVLGAVLTGGGIILLLAHNWHELTRPLRTVISIAPLMAAQGLCLYALMKRDASIAWRESTSAFLVLSIGIAISLISQTYNIYGNFGRFILTWTLLSIPAVYLMNAAFPALLCLVGIATWAGYRAGDGEYPYLFWPLCAALAPYFYFMYKKLGESTRFKLLNWAGVIFFSISFNFIFNWSYHSYRAPNVLPGSSFLAYSAFYSILYFIGKSRYYSERHLFSNPCLIFGSLGISVQALFYTYNFSWKHFYWRFFSGFSIEYWNILTCEILIGIITLAVLMIGALALLAIRIRQKSFAAIPFGAYFLVALFVYILYVRTAPGAEEIRQATFIETNDVAPFTLNLILFNLYLFMIGVFTVVQGVRESKLGVINFGMLILASQIISRFFDTNLSFVLRGIIFIIFGAGFLLVNIIIVKKRRGT